MRLLGFLLLGYLPILGGAFTRVDAWYRGLEKAPFHPPDWVFGPVWSVLYACIGVAFYLLHRRMGRFPRWLWLLVIVHQALNAAWTPVFFAWQQPLAALLLLVLLLTAIAALLAIQWRHAKPAFALFLPYAGWACYALALNAWIVAAN